MPVTPSKPTGLTQGVIPEDTVGRHWTGETQIAQARAVKSGYMMKSPTCTSGYNAVLEFKDGSTTSHPFETMRAGEAFIRSEAPMPPKVDRARGVPTIGRFRLHDGSPTSAD